ncbi:hypothetical protein H8S10_07710 [Clostridium sp. NSJ-49]|uniref:hypothetical protein n=1 Tax=Clostridium TaxID=1485 RepID=UPI00164A2B78|nr:hypothetical protein [Clostridium sp. NSJ-49]MBC5625336.1 hypothetical protein [Clostridium sp. NSJ-49]
MIFSNVTVVFASDISIPAFAFPTLDGSTDFPVRVISLIFIFLPLIYIPVV